MVLGRRLVKAEPFVYTPECLTGKVDNEITL